MREKIESKPVSNPLDEPSWERVGREIGRVSRRTFLSEEIAQTKSEGHIVSRNNSIYSEILT